MSCKPELSDNGLISPLCITPELDRVGVLARMENWLLFFFLLGIAARCIRYFLAFPLWEDECFVAVSVYKCSYMELLQPLIYHQVAPVFFLWLGKACSDILGFSELSLRLPAFITSIVSMFIFWRISRKVLSGSARLFAVALFSVSYSNIRYAAEYKPYGMDMFVSLLLVWFLLEWLLAPHRRCWLIGLILWVPLAIGFSFPAVFTAAAVSLIVFCSLLSQKGQTRDWQLWLLYSVIFSVSFLVAYFYSIKPQMAAELGFMSDCWDDTFPPHNPIKMIWWIITTHTGESFSHPVGGERFGSTLTAILMFTGIVALFKNARGKIAWLLLLPLLINFAAALVQKYPYGGHVKFFMYAAPMIYIVSGLGAATLLNGHARRASAGNTRNTVIIVMSLIATIAIACSAIDVVKPYKNKADQRIRAFSQWFWYNASFASEAYCLKEDMDVRFSQATWTQLSWSASYLCNQYIYRPKKVVREPFPDNLSPEALNNVYFVHYHMPDCPDFDNQKYEQWIKETSEKMDFISKDTFPLVRNDKRERRVICADQIEIFKFRKKVQ